MKRLMALLLTLTLLTPCFALAEDKIFGKDDKQKTSLLPENTFAKALETVLQVIGADFSALDGDWLNIELDAQGETVKLRWRSGEAEVTAAGQTLSLQQLVIAAMGAVTPEDGELLKEMLREAADLPWPRLELKTSLAGEPVNVMVHIDVDSADVAACLQKLYTMVGQNREALGNLAGRVLAATGLVSEEDAAQAGLTQVTRVMSWLYGLMGNVNRQPMSLSLTMTASGQATKTLLADGLLTLNGQVCVLTASGTYSHEDGMEVCGTLSSPQQVDSSDLSSDGSAADQIPRLAQTYFDFGIRRSSSGWNVDVSIQPNSTETRWIDLTAQLSRYAVDVELNATQGSNGTLAHGAFHYAQSSFLNIQNPSLKDLFAGLIIFTHADCSYTDVSGNWFHLDFTDGNLKMKLPSGTLTGRSVTGSTPFVRAYQLAWTPAGRYAALFSPLTATLATDSIRVEQRGRVWELLPSILGEDVRLSLHTPEPDAAAYVLSFAPLNTGEANWEFTLSLDRENVASKGVVDLTELVKVKVWRGEKE